MAKKKSKKMREHATELADRLAPHVESAREKAAPVIADARDKAAPLVTEAKDRAAPALAEARDKLTHDVLPVITAALAAAGEATEDVREETKRRGKATAAALKGDLDAPQEKKHRFRKLLVVLGLGGVAAFVAKKLSDRQAASSWQSSYTPPPAPAAPVTPATTSLADTPTADAAAAAAATSTTDDEGAAGPDEAAADASEAPHMATTPDNPVEEVEVKRD